MGLPYSAKRLVSAPLRSKGRGKREQRLQLYAFLTAILGMLISLTALVLKLIRL